MHVPPDLETQLRGDFYLMARIPSRPGAAISANWGSKPRADGIATQARTAPEPERPGTHPAPRAPPERLGAQLRGSSEYRP
jgi:hypothetical protein